LKILILMYAGKAILVGTLLVPRMGLCAATHTLRRNSAVQIYRL